jgi:hypothetical protein
MNKKGREINLRGPLSGDISSQTNKKAVGSDAHGLDSYEFCLPGNRRTPKRRTTIATIAGANTEEHGGADNLIHRCALPFSRFTTWASYHELQLRVKMFWYEFCHEDNFLKPIVLSARARRGKRRRDRRLCRTSQARDAGCCTRQADRVGQRSGSGCHQSVVRSARRPVCHLACQGWAMRLTARCSTRHNRCDSPLFPETFMNPPCFFFNRRAEYLDRAAAVR